MSIVKQHQRRKARLAALAWPKGAYPAVFDYPPKPLAIGMGKAIVAAAIGAGIENHPARAALSYWVRSHSYQIALAAPGAMRCDLSGAEVEAVDAQHAEEARRRLEDIAARRAAKRAPAR
jgi:sRNA-binding protein